MKTTIVQLKKRIQDLDGISNKIDGLVTKIEDVKSEVITKIDSVAPVSNDSGTNTYADALKNAKKSASRKHLLVVEPNTADASVDDMKPEVGAALTGIQVADSKFLEKKIVLNFETMAERDAAAEKVRSVQNVTVKEVKKLDPCIMICNVAQAESKDELMKNLLERNEYLQSVADIGKKIKHVFNKVAAGGTRHYVLRCDPQVRKLIRENHDNLKLEWGSYNVRDRYITTTCFYCQKFGHIEAKCPIKEKKEPPTCGHCAEAHRSKECNREENVKKCVNCVEQKKDDVNHSVNERCCASLLAEIKKVMDKTDHGY